MDYYVNEYSLRGQFESIEDFFSSLRTYTFPVLKKIEENKENVIWKKDTFWQCEICKGIPICNIPKKKNERSTEGTYLRAKMMKLYREAPFWDEEDPTEIEIIEYNFDEEYREQFEKNNCFSKALENEGRIISFIHPSYQADTLSIMVCCNQEEKECVIDNISKLSWWEREPFVKNWRVGNKYLIEVRSKEFDYHPPHFHVSCNEFAAVFKLKDGELYTCGKKEMSPHMRAEIKEWYQEHSDELQIAWNSLHGN